MRSRREIDEQAIRDAVAKGGFALPGQFTPQGEEVFIAVIDDGNTVKYQVKGDNDYIGTAELFLDPAFWQALGKARGWNDWCYDGNGERQAHWLFNWHRFIDHLADGKDAESFFKNI